MVTNLSPREAVRRQALAVAGSRGEKGFDLGEKVRPGGFVGEKDVVVTIESDEAGAGD